MGKCSLRHHAYLRKKNNQGSGYFCLLWKNSKMSVSTITETLSMGETSLSEESVAQESSKHNKYQLNFL